MKSIGSILERLKKTLGKDTFLKEALTDSIMRATGISVDQKTVSIKGTVLEIEASPAKKSEIRMKEKEIIRFFEETSGQKASRIFYK